MPEPTVAAPVRKDVFQVISRGEGKDAIWKQIGVAFVNKDGSLNAILDSIPGCTDGTYKIHIRDHKDKAPKAA